MAEMETDGETIQQQENGEQQLPPAGIPETDGNRSAPPEPAADRALLRPDGPPEPLLASQFSISVEASGQEQHGPALLYPVVAFGASAGGLDAVREVLTNLDPDTGMAFVLITHLAPNQRSYMSEILERHTRMPVNPLEDGQRPLPNQLYVLQPGQRVTLRGGLFRVEEIVPEERWGLVIDTFFRSLAADQKNHAVGVILSGADSDGALGLKAIKAEGGIAVVQTPESASYSGMPRHSIAADHVDMVLPPAEIAAELGRLGRQFTRPEVRSLEEGLAAPDDERVIGKILQLLRGISGLDLRLYKPETIRRRIARRMLLLRVDRLAEYHRMLQIRADELRLLQEDILINVTHFFRDPGFWDSLRLCVLPALFQDRPPEKPVRIWCAGCSTGEEAYSLAILVLEYLSQNGLDTPVQIFGTDASEQSIETARLAIYPETIAGEIAPERLRRYFVKVDRGYQVSKRVRDACIFARQNLCADPPFSHIDILSCRNVMIYFNQVLQRQVMLTFHYALEPGGYMLLGMSEGLRDYGEVFSTVDRKHKIYLKSGAHLPFSYDPPRTYAISQATGSSRAPLVEMESSAWPEQELQRAADRIVLARFGPPGLVIDERMNVLQSRGQASRFMEITPGAVSWNLRRVLKDGIVNETWNAVQRAIRENVPASGDAVLIDEEEDERHIVIDVLPITSSASRPRCFLVLFQDVDETVGRKLPEQPDQPQLTVDEKDRLIAQLRQDLNSTRFHLQSLVEERDARNQELVSANEEIQSANEELQSTNEELETTKEELQSANEELQTVNDELQQRNNVLTQTGNDLTNLLNSVNIPLLMLNSELQIRQFTPPMQRLLSVRSSDIGRSITEIRLQLSIENLEPILNDVLESLGTREQEVQDKEGRWHLLRIRPYRTADNKIEGLVVLLLDIDQLRRSQQQLMDARDFAKSVVESVPVPIVVLNRDCTIRIENTAFRELVQMPATDLSGRSLPDLAALHWGLTDLGRRLEPLLQDTPGEALEFEHEWNSPQRRTLLIKAQALSTDDSRVLLLTLEDISLRRETERLINREKKELETEIATAARKLNRTQDELRGLAAHLITVQEEERQRVARELHDDISQRLSLIEIALQEVGAGERGQQAFNSLGGAREQVHRLNDDIRALSHRLHPAILNDLGLPAALKALVAGFGERHQMPATFATQDLPEAIPQEPAVALYRITQEALRNVAKHAGKTHVKVLLIGENGGLTLKIMDFGLGFDTDAELPSAGLGMISMQERARLVHGSFHVQSALGQGTFITVQVPLEEHA